MLLADVGHQCLRRLIGCAYLREYVDFGNVLHEPFLRTWDHPLGRQLRSGKVERSCGSCAATQGSHGGCRATAYAFHGRFDAPDPFDLELNNGVDLQLSAGAAGAPARPVVRPLPEIKMCMVYRPRPARIVTLNPSSWMLLEACDGTTVAEIEETYAAMLADKGRAAQTRDVRKGLQALVDLSLVRVCEVRGGRGQG